ncbi:MAG: phage holin family protein [Chloroflexota bacterium]
MNLLIRLGINAVALYAAAYFIDGITLSENWVSVIIVAAIFGIINAIIKPIVKILSIPFILITLGLFTLVVNALMLWLTSALSSALVVDGFGPAFWGAIIISLISWLLSSFLSDDEDDD